MNKTNLAPRAETEGGKFLTRLAGYRQTCNKYPFFSYSPPLSLTSFDANLSFCILVTYSTSASSTTKLRSSSSTCSDPAPAAAAAAPPDDSAAWRHGTERYRPAIGDRSLGIAVNSERTRGEETPREKSLECHVLQRKKTPFGSVRRENSSMVTASASTTCGAIFQVTVPARPARLTSCTSCWTYLGMRSDAGDTYRSTHPNLTSSLDSECTVRPCFKSPTMATTWLCTI